MFPLLGSMLLGGLGSFFGASDAASNARRVAEARNAVLRDAIAKLEGFYDTNKGTFDKNMSNYSVEGQGARLTGAQGKRSDAVTGNLKLDDTGAGAPISASASPAVRSEMAKRMLSVHDAAVSRARAIGSLGGYGDAWLQNNLGNAQTSRDLGVTNSFAEGRKALVQPEQDLAAAAAYRAPSMFGPLLSGAGQLLGGFAGRGGSLFG